jgi:hypothetical protein
MADLSQGAQLALASLERDPDLNNPYAIFLGPTNQERMSAGEIERGLRELEAAGLATHDFHGWRLLPS